MPKQTRHARYEEDEAEFIAADGAVVRLIERACENPALSGGLFVMALTATAIVSNAMFLQNVRHPEPLFSTRPPVAEMQREMAPPLPEPSPVAVPAPPATGQQTTAPSTAHDPLAALIPVPRPAPTRQATANAPVPPAPVTAPVSAPVAAPVSAADAAAEARLRDIQTQLAERGLYLGSIDGKYGALSRSAIANYERTAGLPVTGEPSQALLDHMRAPPPPAMAAAPPAPPPPPVETTGTVVNEQAELAKLRYQRIQMALNRIGYGPVATSGVVDTETASAIRRFELDNGLPISGAANEQVVERLIAIGALPAI